ncbi:DUF6891 domain-containing protein [Acuticoccus sediminis]|nr:hypothetical protein [Acuticoccus sediminis]
MTESDRTGLETEIKYAVWGGFESPEEVREEILELVDDAHALSADDRRFIEDALDEAWGLKRGAESDWPAITDVTRLMAAFDQLEKDGILALHRAGYTQSDGMADVAEIYDEMGGPDSGVKGWTFYHEQDVADAIETGILWLAFGATDPAADPMTIAAAVASTLDAYGFAVERPADPSRRIKVEGIVWRNRSPQD